MEKVLILKKNDNDFEKFYSKRMERLGIDVYPAYKNVNKLEYWIREIHLKGFGRNVPGEHIWLGDWKKKITLYDTIIIFDSLKNIGIVRAIHEIAPSSRLIFWYWNITGNKRRLPLPEWRKFCEFWSFDQGECEVYNFRFNHQFYFQEESQMKLNISEKLDGTFFVGADKGRLGQIIEIKKIFDKFRILNKWIIVTHESEKATKSEYKGIEIIEKPITYTKTIEYVQKYKCIVDIVQDDQVGITVRTLEALFFEKKLITNNVSIKNMPFYNSQNIFVIGEDSWDDFEKFWRAPVSVNKQFLKMYTYEDWIEQFGISGTEKV